MDFYFIIAKIFSPIVAPSNFLIFGSTLFFFLWLIKKNLIYKKIFIIFFASISLFSLFPIGKGLFYYFYEKDYYEQNIPQNIDFIFVPSGGEDRLINAINIKNKYDLKKIKIIYSSGNIYLDKKKAIDQEKSIIEIIISNSKIDPDDIIFLPEARNTLENINRLDGYLKKINKRKSNILLITHAYHIKRCLYISDLYDLNIFPYASSFTTKDPSTGIINSYQRICFLCNLSFLDFFAKETLSLIFLKFFVN